MYDAYNSKSIFQAAPYKSYDQTPYVNRPEFREVDIQKGGL